MLLSEFVDAGCAWVIAGAGTTTLIAFILVESSFMVMRDFTIFISIFAVGMMLLFASVAPTSTQPPEFF